MLHNTGPYGPGEAPINMTPPVNMPQLSSPLNIGHNLSNLSKIAQSSPQMPSGHYNLPDYSSFSHSPLDLGSQMSSFPSYPTMGFPPNYFQSNQSGFQSGAWQNGLLPMNLNTQNNQNQSMSHLLPNFESRSQGTVPNFNNKTSSDIPKHTVINIPQVPLKASQNSYDFENHGLFNANQDRFNNFYKSQNDGKILEDMLRNTKTEELIDRNKMNTTEDKFDKNSNNGNQQKPPIGNRILEKDNMAVCLALDSTGALPCSQMGSKTQGRETQKLINETKRRSLENTVRLIEDILISTEKNKESLQQRESLNKAKKDLKTKTTENKTVHINHTTSTEKFETITTENPSTAVKTKSVESNNLKTVVNEELNSVILGNDKNSVIPINDENFVIPNKGNEEIPNNGNKETIPTQLVEKVMIKEEIPDPDIETSMISCIVKIEHCDPETDDVNPFQRDLNGCTRDTVNGFIVDGEYSVNEAMEAIKLGNTSSYYECPNCNLLFNHPKRFLIHTKWHTFGLTNEKRQEILKEREMLKNQRKEAKMLERRTLKEEKREEKEDPDKTYVCKDCDRTFYSKGSLKNHRQRLHPKRVRECKICNVKVCGWLALKNHMETHITPAGFNCPYCEKTFKFKHSLAKHKDTHLEKTVSCPHCPKMFGSVQQMKTHQTVHKRAEQGQTFTCSDCGKGFYQSYSLVIHERTHRNEKPFQCTICNTNYITNSSLKRHVKVSHSNTKPFECDTCKRCFGSANTRDRHSVRMHGSEDLLTFQCTECDKRFLKTKDLRKHMRQVHEKRRRKRKEVSDSE